MLFRSICVGMVVHVPFGKGSREISGYVAGLTRTPSMEPEKMKEILCLKSSAETTESNLILLADWMKRQYGSTMIQALRTVFPVKAKIQAKEQRTIVKTASDEQAQKMGELWRQKNYRARVRLLEYILQQGQADYGHTLRLLGIGKSVVDALEEEGIVQVVRDRKSTRLNSSH